MKNTTIKMNRTPDGRYAEGSTVSKRAIAVKAYIADSELIVKLANEKGLTFSEVAREAIALGIAQLQERLEKESGIS